MEAPARAVPEDARPPPDGSHSTPLASDELRALYEAAVRQFLSQEERPARPLSQDAPPFVPRGAHDAAPLDDARSCAPVGASPEGPCGEEAWAHTYWHQDWNVQPWISAEAY